MEPLPQVHGYRWRSELNGGTLLKGAKNYRWCRGPVPCSLRTNQTGGSYSVERRWF